MEEKEIIDLKLDAKDENELEYGETPIEPEYWFLKAGLYHREDYNFEHNTGGDGFEKYRTNLTKVLAPDITIDVYCPKCKKETVFSPENQVLKWVDAYRNPIVRNGNYIVHFVCSRKHCNSDLYYIFNLNNGLIIKIGQYPSIADLILPEIAKYKKILDSNLISDWQRAIGL